MPAKRTTKKPASAKKSAARTVHSKLRDTAHPITQRNSVRAYVLALTAPRVRGRGSSPTTLQKGLARVTKALAEKPDPVRFVELRAQQEKLEGRLRALDNSALADLEKGFIAHAKAFSDRKGITFKIWRELGVPVEVLHAAGITRS